MSLFVLECCRSGEGIWLCSWPLRALEEIEEGRGRTPELSAGAGPLEVSSKVETPVS